MTADHHEAGPAPSLLAVLRRVQRRHLATARPDDTMSAEQALTFIRQVIEDAQPDEFAADTRAECDAWTQGIVAYRANLLRAFHLEDEFEPSPVVWEVTAE